jgi:hypothetical protein
VTQIDNVVSRVFARANGHKCSVEDIGPQAKRLMSVVKVAVEGRDRPEETAPFVIKVSARQVHSGVRPWYIQPPADDRPKHRAATRSWVTSK